MAKPPNILLVVMDTARADHLSCYGYPRQTTPALDALAGEGTLFENACTPAGWTLPAHASLFTSLYPSAHGLNRVGDRLAEGVPTVAERLARLGYRTVGITNNAFIGKLSGLCRGFETFIEPTAPLSGVRPAIVRKAGRRLHRLLFGQRWDIGASRTAALALRQMAAGGKRDRRPFFMFLNFMEPHQTYGAPASYRLMFVDGDRERAEAIPQDVAGFLTRAFTLSEEELALLRGLYDGQLRYLDLHLGEMLARMRRLGLLDETVVVITSDHGENLGEHGLMGHLFSLHETILRVPLIVRHPAAFAAGARSQQPINLVDVAPTLLELAGAAPDPTLQGRSFAQEPEVPGRASIAEYINPQLDLLRRRFPAFDCSVYDRELRAIRQGRFKLIWSSRGDHALHDLSRDPGERENLIESHPEVAGRLAGELAAWAAALTPAASARGGDIDRETIERLSGLGYI